MRICFCAPFLVQSTATVRNIHLPYLFIPSRHCSVFKFSYWHRLSHTLGDFYNLQNRWKFSKNWFFLAQVGVDFKRVWKLFLVKLIFLFKIQVRCGLGQFQGVRLGPKRLSRHGEVSKYLYQEASWSCRVQIRSVCSRLSSFWKLNATWRLYPSKLLF